jgi:hypothetical protein
VNVQRILDVLGDVDQDDLSELADLVDVIDVRPHSKSHLFKLVLQDSIVSYVCPPGRNAMPVCTRAALPFSFGYTVCLYHAFLTTVRSAEARAGFLLRVGAWSVLPL